MSIGSAIAIYFIIWWVCLFVMLPIKVTSQAESGHVVPGSEAGAPDNPRLGLKLLLTTGLAVIVFAAVYAIILYKPIALKSIPILGSV